MKKIIFIVLASLLYSNLTFAQAFEKGSLNFDLGVGFDVFGTKQEITTTVTGQNFENKEESDTTDGAASFVVPISFEYGVSNKIGVGLDLIISNYFIDEEDKEFTNSVKAVDFGLKVNYHLLSSDKNDLFVGLGLGISSITWDLNTATPNQIAEEFSGSGAYWRIGVTDRIFFTDNIGVFFSLAYKGYNYDLDTDFKQETIDFFNGFNAKIEQNFTFKMNGVDLNAGLAVKF